MFKTLDKFILSRFIGPFVLAYCVVTFIFLIQHLIRYFAHFVGKGLELSVFAELFSYFALMLTPIALPLAVLLSSLMSFGSLGEHSELTAIKSSGISLLRILRPVALFSLLLTAGAVYFNDVISPTANLNAYSLLYDIKQKKPTLEFKESAFYNGLPGYSIWIDDKEGPDGDILKGIKIYNHTSRQGNSDLITAERGRMYSANNSNYLVLELINGARFTNLSAERGRLYEHEFLETRFDSSKIVFSMESFNLKETEKDLFKGHNMMKTSRQLFQERDSVINTGKDLYAEMPERIKAYTSFQFIEELDSLAKVREAGLVSANQVQENLPAPTTADSVPNPRPKSFMEFSLARDIPIIDEFLGRRGLPSPDDDEEEVERLEKGRDSLAKATSPLQLHRGKEGAIAVDTTAFKPKFTMEEARRMKLEQAKKSGRNIDVTIDPVHSAETAIYKDKTKWREQRNYRELNMAWSKANGMKIAIEDAKRREDRLKDSINKFEIELHNKYARSAAVFIMFLIGAPLGAIIKKGGLGVPILISILFFIIYYITTITGTKLANSMLVPPVVGCWGGDALLLCCGLIFLRQAYKDSRLFDTDYYAIIWDKLSAFWKQRSLRKA